MQSQLKTAPKKPASNSITGQTAALVIVTLILAGLLAYVFITYHQGPWQIPFISNSSRFEPSNSADNSQSYGSNESTQTAPTIYKIGDTVNINGADVTVVKIIDPASGADEFKGYPYKPDSGYRFVAVVVKVHNSSGSILRGYVDDNMSLIDSNGQVHDAEILDTVNECSDFSNREYAVAPGYDETGCVTYQVKDGATPRSVYFGQNIQWTVQ